MIKNFYPSAGDGVCIMYSAISYDWANVIAAASSTSANYTTNPNNPCYAAGGGVDTYCGRAFFPFNTASLAGATINSVTFHGYITTFDATETWYVVPSTQSSATELVVSDYSKISKASTYGNVEITGTGAYTITLNISCINAGGITKLAFLHSYDYTNTSPGSWQHYLMKQNYSEASSNKPYLEIDYKPASSGFFQFL